MKNAHIETFEIETVDTASTRWERWVRRFDNFVVAKGINNDTRIKAMMLHHAGDTVFELLLQPCPRVPTMVFLQIMHPRTFHIKNPSDAKLASLSVFRKWPVSMATIAKIGNY